MIKEKSNEVRDMLILMGECRNSRASMTGGDRAGGRFIFHRGKKKKSMKRKRGVS